MERLPALRTVSWTPLAVGLWVDEPVPLQHGQARGTLFNTYLPVPPPPDPHSTELDTFLGFEGWQESDGGL